MAERKCALVTGSVTGIGRAMILRLARDGFDTVINYHRQERAEEARRLIREVQAMGTGVIAVQADVSQSTDCDRLVQETMDAFGRIDVLVNNAGITNLTPMQQMTDEDFHRVMATNAYGTFYMMRSAVPIMKRQRSGSIINISSVGGLYGAPWSIGYAASKGAVISMTKTAAKELAISKIRVNAVAPGGCKTGIIEMGEKQLQAQLKYVTMGRLGLPEEMAGAVSFLASEDASYITGHVLEVSGGVMM